VQNIQVDVNWSDEHNRRVRIWNKIPERASGVRRQAQRKIAVGIDGSFRRAVKIWPRPLIGQPWRGDFVVSTVIRASKAGFF